MRSIYLVNIYLILIFSTLLLLPETKNPRFYNDINTAYSSVCMVTSTNAYRASGVLLESGYVITASHVIDHNKNNQLDPEEAVVTLKFPLINQDYKAKVVSFSPMEKLDIVILKPLREVPLRGVKLISELDYWLIKVGTPDCVIGMQNGVFPANITDGRIIDMYIDRKFHRSSSSSFYGNSGGGIFIEEQLIGIVVAVGMGETTFNMPVFERKRLAGIVEVPIRSPLYDCTLYIPAPRIISYLADQKLTHILATQYDWPYQEYYAFAAFQAFLTLVLCLIYKIISSRVEQQWNRYIRRM